MKATAQWLSLPLTEAFWFQEGPGVRNWQFTTSGIKLLNVANIEKGGTLNLEKTDRHLDETEVAKKYSHFLVDAGDLVIASSGISFDDDGLLRTRGAFVRAEQLPLCLNTSTIRFKAIDGVSDLRFLRLWLNGREFRSQITKLVTGTAQQNFGPSHLKVTKITLPPLTEQRRIAEVLDRSEALRAKRRAALAQLDSLTQSIFLDLFGDPATNPKSWPTGTLGEIATFVGGGTPSRARPEFYEGLICWATSKDMKCEFLDDTQEHITEEAIKQSATNIVLPGTILIVVKSKILARSLPVAIARVPTCFGQDLKGIKVSDRCDVAFVTTALRSGSRWLLERARGINTEGLTLDHLKMFPLQFPPIELQRDFARRVGAVEKLKTAQRASLAELDALFASLQHRAFRGEL